MSSGMIAQLLLVVGLALAISFLCSIMEAVLLSVRHSYIGVMRERGERVADLLARMREDIDEPIAAILTLNTIAHTVGATVGGALALQGFGDRWIALFSAFLTLAVLIFSEIIPKTIGATYWKQLAKPVAYTIRSLIVVMKPILIPLAYLNRLITPRGEREPTISRGELEVIAEIGRKEGTIDEEEWEVVTNIMNLDRVKVGDVMTPRTSVVAIPRAATIEEAKGVMLDEGHLRVPVYEESIDQVVGVVLARDLWRADREGVKDLRSIIRPPRFVPASKPVEDLMREMRSERIKLAIVLDEFGGTAGLVTLEDLIEEIVGEIQDEHEAEPLPFEEVGEGEVWIDAAMPIYEINERLDLSLPEDLQDTIGGFIFAGLGRIAKVGDEIQVDGGRFRALLIDGRRIDRVAFLRDSKSGDDLGASGV
ncbi:MAG: hemolysin family protein [Myxococcota bacterium]